MEIAKEQISALKRAVGARTRSLREAAGYEKVPHAAKALGISGPALYDIEKGANFLSPEVLVKMSDLYKVPPAAFFPGSEIIRVQPSVEEALQIITEALRVNLPEEKPVTTRADSRPEIVLLADNLCDLEKQDLQTITDMIFAMKQGSRKLDRKKRELLRLLAECDDIATIEDILDANRTYLERAPKSPKKHEAG